MNITEIENQIKLIKRVEQAKADLATLTINWETDIAKMDFSKLENDTSFIQNNISLKVSYVNEKQINADEVFASGWDESTMIKFINVIKRNEKIIPPITRIGYEVDNGISMRIGKPFLCNTGRRMLLARYLCCSIIPTLIWEVVQIYKFSITEYVFKEIDINNIEIKSKISNASYKIDMRYYYIDTNEANQLVIKLR